MIIAAMADKFRYVCKSFRKCKIICAGLIFFFALGLTGCGNSKVIYLQDRLFVDFNDLEHFTFYDSHLELCHVTLLVPGESATLAIIGRPNTEYHLTVVYSAGPSRAAGLGFATSDEEGRVSWTWHVGPNTRPGRFNAFVTGSGDRLVVDIVVSNTY